MNAVDEIDYLANEGFDFFYYREVFERLVCEPAIRAWTDSGSNLTPLIELRQLPPISTNPRPNDTGAIMLGVNHHSNRRVRRLADFFCDWENFLEEHLGRDPRAGVGRGSAVTRYDVDYFSSVNCNPRDLIGNYLSRKTYLGTPYFRRLVEKLGTGGIGLQSANQKNKPVPWMQVASLKVRQKISLSGTLAKVASDYLRMLENVRSSGAKIVHNSKSANPTADLVAADYPWAIEYPNHLKYRDGAHRRAVFSFLGQSSLPHLVFRADFALKSTSQDEKLSVLPEEHWTVFRQKVLEIS